MQPITLAALCVLVALAANMIWLAVLRRNPHNILGRDMTPQRRMAAANRMREISQSLAQQRPVRSSALTAARRYAILRAQRLRWALEEAGRSLGKNMDQLDKAVSHALLEIAPRNESDLSAMGSGGLEAVAEAIGHAADAFVRRDAGATHEALSAALFVSKTGREPALRGRRGEARWRREHIQRLLDDLGSVADAAVRRQPSFDREFDDLEFEWREAAVERGDPHLFLLIHLLGMFRDRFFSWFTRPGSEQAKERPLRILQELAYEFLRGWQADDLVAEYEATCNIITLRQMMAFVQSPDSYVVRHPAWEAKLGLWTNTT
jgi:hypothetical protein